MNPLRELEELLDKELSLIRKGAIDEIARLSDLKTELLAKAGREIVDDSDLGAVKSKADRNARLLLATSNGIRSALQQVRDAQGMLDQTTYERSGSKTRLLKRSSKIERRL